VSGGWQQVTISDVADLVRGVTYSKEDSRDTPAAGFSPVLRATNIQDSRLVLESDLVFVPSDNVSATQRLRAGDIVMATSSGSKHLVGKSALMRTDWAGSFGAFCAALRAKPNIDPRYLSAFLQSPTYWKQVAKKALGVNINNLRRGDIETLALPLPELNEQREIVAEIEKQFSRLDEAIANLQRVKANLKRYKASVLKDAVEGRLVPLEAELARREGRSFETSEQLLQRILEARRAKWAGKGKYKEPVAPDTAGFHSLPGGWVWASGDQLTSVITDGEHITPRRTSDGVLLLSARNVLNGRLALDNVDYVPEDEYERIAKRIAIQAGDVLLSCSGTVGRSCVVPAGLRFTLVRSVAVLRPVIMLADFMTYNLQSPLGQSQIDDRKTQTAQANLFQGKIRQLVFALPPLAEQARIVAEVDRRLSIIREVEADVDANLLRAQALRQATLRSAFAGSS